MQTITLKRGDSYTNKTNKPLKYTLKYLNCFDMWQTDAGVLECGQTFQVFNNSTVKIFLN